MKKDMRRGISFVILSAFLTLQILPYLPTSIQNIPLIYTLKKASLLNPMESNAIGISSASATLTNPRLSFDGIINATVAIGGSTLVVKNSVGGDINTKNLFPLDSIKIDANAVIPVASLSADNVTFTIKTPLVSAANINNHMTVAQSGQLKVQFYTSSSVPVGGSIKITVPAPNELVAATQNGIPLAQATLASSGFDTNSMTNANTTCPGSFTASTFTPGASGTPHTFTCNYTGGTALAAGTPLTVIIGDNTIGLVNPPPTTASHTQGIADIYTIKAETYSGTAGSGSLLEDTLAKVAPVEGVLVTATVDETLSFTVGGYNSASQTRCGEVHTAAGITTSATAVPWGTISSGYTVDKNEAVQQLSVTTNASGGYKVYAEENDQMGEEGATCTGTAPDGVIAGGSAEWGFGTSSCIRDYNLGSHTATANWGATPGTNYGFGYAIENVPVTGGTDGVALYAAGGAYMARQFADVQGLEDKYAAGAELMSNGGPVSGSSVYVCYRINIVGTQPAGYYYNKIKYTAVPKF